MIKRCEGFIFFMTLCTILVISVLLITLMQQVLLYHKALNKQEQLHQNFYQLEGLASQLASDFSEKNHCVEHRDSVNQIIKELLHNKGCLLAVGQARYRYIIEDLGDFSCLVLYQNQNKRATRHLRISILLLADKQNPASVLQLRFIKPSVAKVCLEKEHPVTPGISSWRYLTDIKIKNFVL